ncbi:MAG TPA: alpha-amylase family glycosyl hydrolase, partial [Pseudonocardia sp.]|nr:alpha-amylase family glycosyl hydrolase [Pseudonocardia sp.]
GLSGFRVDAVPFLLETVGPEDAAELPDPHDYLADLRAFLGRRNGEAILLGEVNLPYADTVRFYGSDRAEELTMCFDFVANQQLYLSLVREDAGPLAGALRQRPAAPQDGQWATFVRNHDELSLDKLPEAQRKEVFDALGADEGMQIYGRGLRRRLPPMLGGDQRRIRMVYSLLFALPGTPVLFYGEEIGMGENLAAPGRHAVRTPMQWSPEPGAGFSAADPADFVEPLVEGAFGPQHVNVRDQERDPGSLMSWVRLLIERYRDTPELAWGTPSVLDPGAEAPSVLANRADTEDCAVIALHNLAGTPATARLTLSDLAGHALRDVLPADGTVGVAGDGTVEVRLDGYGCRWLRTDRSSGRRRGKGRP